MPGKPTTTPKSWRDQIKVRPAADLFPDEQRRRTPGIGRGHREKWVEVSRRALVEGDHAGPEPGSKPPNPNYQLLDGRNRLDAAEFVGLTVSIDTRRGEVSIGKPDTGQLPCRREPLFEFQVSWDGFNKLKPVREPWIDPYAYLMSANLHRRHLTTRADRKSAFNCFDRASFAAHLKDRSWPAPKRRSKR